jgi:hypothetical protein
MAKLVNTQSVTKKSTTTKKQVEVVQTPAAIVSKPADEFEEVSTDEVEEVAEESPTDIFLDSVKKIPKEEREIQKIKYTLGEGATYFPAVDAEYTLEVVESRVFRSNKNSLPYMSFRLRDVDDDTVYTHSVCMTVVSAKQTMKMVFDNLVRTMAPMAGISTSSISEEELQMLHDLFNGRNKKLSKSIFEDNSLAGNYVIGRSTISVGKDGKEYCNMRFKPCAAPGDEESAPSDEEFPV